MNLSCKDTEYLADFHIEHTLWVVLWLLCSERLSLSTQPAVPIWPLWSRFPQIFRKWLTVNSMILAYVKTLCMLVGKLIFLNIKWMLCCIEKGLPECQKSFCCLLIGDLRSSHLCTAIQNVVCVHLTKFWWLLLVMDCTKTQWHAKTLYLQRFAERLISTASFPFQTFPDSRLVLSIA